MHITHFALFFLTNFASIMSLKILLISCDNRIKLQNIVQYRVDPKKRYRWGVVIITIISLHITDTASSTYVGHSVKRKPKLWHSYGSKENWDLSNFICVCFLLLCSVLAIQELSVYSWAVPGDFRLVHVGLSCSTSSYCSSTALSTFQWTASLSSAHQQRWQDPWG